MILTLKDWLFVLIEEPGSTPSKHPYVGLQPRNLILSSGLHWHWTNVITQTFASKTPMHIKKNPKQLNIDVLYFLFYGNLA